MAKKTVKKSTAKTKTRTSSQKPTRKTAASAKSAVSAKTVQSAKSSRKPSKKASVKKASVKKASVAKGPSKEHLAFMLSGWAKPSKSKIARIPGWQRFKARRRALSERFAGECLLIPSGQEKVRNHDSHFRFRPGSDFFYLTGCDEACAVLALVPKGRSGHEAVLFVQPDQGRTDPAFFLDRHQGALWVGPRLGLEGSLAHYGVDKTAALTDLPDILKKYIQSSGFVGRQLRGLDADAEQKSRGKAAKDADDGLAAAIADMRLIKDSHEITAIKEALDITQRGFEDAIAAIRAPQASERHIEVAFGARARLEGNDVGYHVIAAAGSHACVLHWNRNNAPLKRGELVLIDAGAEGSSLYTGDITRTLPVSGRFSGAQKDVYQIVLAAQEAAFAAIKPGQPFLAPHKAAMEVLAQGLIDLGVLSMGLEEALDPKTAFYRRYTLHGVSHMLGLDVHDCAHADKYSEKPLQAGMVLTVEPGLYFQPDDLTVASHFRGIGIRIEDDVMVRRGGIEILSEGIPRKVEEIESWMTDIWAQ